MVGKLTDFYLKEQKRNFRFLIFFCFLLCIVIALQKVAPPSFNTHTQINATMSNVDADAAVTDHPRTTTSSAPKPKLILQPLSTKEKEEFFLKTKHFLTDPAYDDDASRWFKTLDDAWKAKKSPDSASSSPTTSTATTCDEETKARVSKAIDTFLARVRNYSKGSPMEKALTEYYEIVRNEREKPQMQGAYVVKVLLFFSF